jgi:hypothetical protein
LYVDQNSSALSRVKQTKMKILGRFMYYCPKVLWRSLAASIGWALSALLPLGHGLSEETHPQQNCVSSKKQVGFAPVRQKTPLNEIIEAILSYRIPSAIGFLFRCPNEAGSGTVAH